MKFKKPQESKGDDRDMSDMKPLVIIGTRPEAIKLAPVIQELYMRGLKPIVCLTGQHEVMAREVLDYFGIAPQYVLRSRNGVGDMTSTITLLLQSVKYDLVIVQGDTNSALAGALAAFHSGVRAAHVEAGLRTNDINSPRPEEFNRRVITLAAQWHFAPTQEAYNNLRRGGSYRAEGWVEVVGNTGIDALLATVPDNEPDGTVLVTSHRRENQGKRLEEICRAVEKLASRHPDNQFIWPVHPNPEVERIVYSVAISPNLKLVPPLPYPELVDLLSRCTAVLTDSGGLCEESVTLGIPTVILRDKTERMEAVRRGLAVQSGTDILSINTYGATAIASSRRSRSTLYGDGKAASRIVDVLLHRRSTRK